MRNYFFSILVHLILLALLLTLWSGVQQDTEQPLQHAIVVDFSHDDVEYHAPRSTAARPAESPLLKPTNNQPKSVTETTTPAPKAAAPEASSQSSQKPEQSEAKAASNEPAKEVKTLVDEALLKRQKEAQAKKEAAEAARVAAAEKAKKEAAEKAKREAVEKARKEAEAKKAAEEKAKKVSHFQSLFKKSAEASQANKASDSAPATESASGTSDSGLKANNIDGAIGKRKVLRIPTITDNSQKQGKVVVKICVDSSGKVVSAHYTQVGSTTADAYLIKLAEDGAKKYLFSESSVERECGRVIIDFKLRA